MNNNEWTQQDLFVHSSDCATSEFWHILQLLLALTSYGTYILELLFYIWFVQIFELD